MAADCSIVASEPMNPFTGTVVGVQAERAAGD